MNHYSSKVVFVRFIRKFRSICEVFSCIGFHIEFLRKFEVSVDFDSSHFIIVELESFDGDGENVG